MWLKIYCVISEDLESSVLVIWTTFIALLWYFLSFLELESPRSPLDLQKNSVNIVKDLDDDPVFRFTVCFLV